MTDDSTTRKTPTDRAANFQTDDNSQRAEMGGANVRIILTGDSVKPIVWLGLAILVFLTLSLTVGLTALFRANDAKTESRLSQYAYEEMREKMSQKGYPLPPDPFEAADKRKAKP